MAFKELLDKLPISDLFKLTEAYPVFKILHDLGIVERSRITKIICDNFGVSILHSQPSRQVFFGNFDIQEALSLTDADYDKFTRGGKPTETILNEISVRIGLGTIPDNEFETSAKPITLVGGPEDDPSNLHGHLYPYQNWMRLNVKRELSKSVSSRVLMQMPTGAGKTKTTMQILVDILRDNIPEPTTIIWLAHTDELCAQAAADFAKIWPTQKLGNIKLWRVWGNQSQLDKFMPEADSNVVVTSLQTMSKWYGSLKPKTFKKFEELRKASSLIVIDEAHLSTAPVYQKVINHLADENTSILGLTATPGRHHVNSTDDATVNLAEFYNNQLICMTDNDGHEIENPIDFLQEEEILSQIELRTIRGIDVKLTGKEKREFENLLDIPRSTLESLGKASTRTLKIFNEVEKLVNDEKLKTIVFCPTKENSDALAEFLKINDINAASITGDTPLNQRRTALQKFVETDEIKVITNYGVLSTGFDAPKIGAVVIARPTMSVVLYSQMIGRGLRGQRSGGTARCVILNVEDNTYNLPDYRDAATYFNQYYN